MNALKPENPIFSTGLYKYLDTVDYFLTGEEFSLWEDRENGLLVTYPSPSSDRLPEYYKSEAYISHKTRHFHLFDRLYALVRNNQHRRKIRLFRRHHPRGEKLLDIGAGTGSFITAAGKAGYDITAVEPSKTARKHFMLSREDCPLYASVDEVSGEKFDIISLWHVLEHIPDLRKFIPVLRSLLREEGCVFMALPNYRSYDATYYGRYWAAYDVPRHLWHFSEKAIIKLMEEYGFVPVQTYPMPWDAYYISLVSEKYKTGKKRLFPALKNAFISNRKARRSGEYSSLMYVFRYASKPKRVMGEKSL